MKKLPLIIALGLIAPLVHADEIFGVNAGIGGWISDYEGLVGEPAVSLKSLGTEENFGTTAFLAIEHGIPLVPNAKLQITKMKADQKDTAPNDFSVGSTDFTAGSTIKSTFDLSHTDITAYYQILDNWINFDLGVTLRKFDGYLQTSDGTQSEEITVDLAVPMVYGKLQFDLPFTGMSWGIESNYTTYRNNSLHDHTIKVSYLFDSAVDLGVEVGLRRMSFVLDDNDLKADAIIKGPYAALIAHF